MDDPHDSILNKVKVKGSPKNKRKRRTTAKKREGSINQDLKDS